MADLISDADKPAYTQALEDIFDTFYREIIVAVPKKKTLSAPNSNASHIYDQKKQTQEQTFDLVTIKAKIRYSKNQFAKATSDIPVETDSSDARIKVREVDKSTIEQSAFMIVDGVQYIVDGPARPSIKFTLRHYSFKLKLRK